jgi:anti-anti-sigma regulatory factor
MLAAADVAEQLTVDLTVQNRTCYLVLSGSLCGASIAALEAKVDQLGCLPCHDVLVDIGSLTDLDEVGAKVILGLCHYVEGRGDRLSVTTAPPAVAAVMERVCGSEIPLALGAEAAMPSGPA